MKLTILNTNKHQDLRASGDTDFNFARNEHTCPLMYSEVAEASRCFPIVFPAAGSKVIRPQALLSAIPDQNSLVEDDGSWGANYLPVHFRRHPFYLGRNPESDTVTLLFDEESPLLNTEEGEPLFMDDDGTWVPSPLLETIKLRLTAFDAEYRVTTTLCERLAQANVLVPGRLTLSREGKEFQIGGFGAVSWNQVLKLDDATLADWTRSGLIQLIIDHIYSLKLFGLKPKKEEGEAAEPAAGEESTAPA